MRFLTGKRKKMEGSETFGFQENGKSSEKSLCGAPGQFLLGITGHQHGNRKH